MKEVFEKGEVIESIRVNGCEFVVAESVRKQSESGDGGMRELREI